MDEHSRQVLAQLRQRMDEALIPFGRIVKTDDFGIDHKDLVWLARDESQRQCIVEHGCLVWEERPVENADGTLQIRLQLTPNLIGNQPAVWHLNHGVAARGAAPV